MGFVISKIQFFVWLFCLLGLSINSAAQIEQQRANNWYFGNQQGFNFSNGTIKQLEDAQIDAVESCCTMSDLNGNLLFYTNGGGREDGQSFGAIWNKQHEIMEGGDLGNFLGGGQSSFQGCLIVPRPAHPNLYYLFTVDHIETLFFENSQFPKGKGSIVFEVDMKANNGKGKVTPGKTLLNPSFEYISGTSHGNCEDYWVILQTSHHYIERDADVPDSFYVFQVTQEGIKQPIKIPMIEGSPFIRDEYGPIKISPDGEKLMCGLFFYDFDKFTGKISNPQPFPSTITDPTASVAFSPNGQYLYDFRLSSIGDTTFVYGAYQYDFNAPSLTNSEIEIGRKELNLTSRGLVGTPQIAPNGKLYAPFWIGKPFTKIAISSIDFPDKKGAAAKFNFDVPALSDGFDQRFLRFGNFMDHIFKEKEEAFFKEKTTSIALDCEMQDAVILSAPPDKTQYVWSENRVEDTLIVYESGKYWVNYAKGCQSGADTFLLTINNQLFNVSLAEDIVFLCDVDPIIVQPIFSNNTILPVKWQDSTFSKNYEIKEAGLYTVEARVGLCLAKDSVKAVALTIPDFDLGKDTIICNGKSFELSAEFSPYNRYEWQNGQTDHIINVSEAGKYELRISNACGSTADDLEVADCPNCELFIPNVFSPNGDYINDFFQALPNNNCVITDFNLKIIDRWGNRIKNLSKLEEVWDGLINRRSSPAGVYWYVARYTINWPDGEKEFKVQTGDVSLVR